MKSILCKSIIQSSNCKMKTFAIVLIAFALLSQVYGYNSQRRTNSGSSEESSDRELSRLLTATQEDVRESSYNWQQTGPSVLSLPEAARYMNKINERLEGSDILSDKTEIKKRVKQLAEQKLNTCKTSEHNAQTLDKGCVGRITGQMMLLIAGVEKVDRNSPHKNN